MKKILFILAVMLTASVSLASNETVTIDYCEMQNDYELRHSKTISIKEIKEIIQTVKQDGFRCVGNGEVISYSGEGGYAVLTRRVLRNGSYRLEMSLITVSDARLRCRVNAIIARQ